MCITQWIMESESEPVHRSMERVRVAEEPCINYARSDNNNNNNNNNRERKRWRSNGIPVAILTISVTCIIAANIFFFRILQVMELLHCALLQWSVITTIAICIMIALLYVWSFLKVLTTSPGFVDVSIWRFVPLCNTTYQRKINQMWMKQRAWLDALHSPLRQREELHTLEQIEQLELCEIKNSNNCVNNYSSIDRDNIIVSNDNNNNNNSYNKMNSMVPIREEHEQEDYFIKENIGNSSNNNNSNNVVNNVSNLDECSLPNDINNEISVVNTNMVNEFEVNGAFRYCVKCACYKPDRAHHCRCCNKCVRCMDHHCVYLNNCIGEGNYKFFFLTVVYGALVGLYICASMIGLCGTCYYKISKINTTKELPRHINNLNSVNVIRNFEKEEDKEYDTNKMEDIRESVLVLTSVWWVVLLLVIMLLTVPTLYLAYYHANLLFVRGMTTLERLCELHSELILERIKRQRHEEKQCVLKKCWSNLIEALSNSVQNTKTLLSNLFFCCMTLPRKRKKLIKLRKVQKNINNNLSVEMGNTFLRQKEEQSIESCNKQRISNVIVECKYREECSNSKNINNVDYNDDYVDNNSSSQRSKVYNHFRGLFGDATCILYHVLPLQPHNAIYYETIDDKNSESDTLDVF